MVLGVVVVLRFGYGREKNERDGDGGEVCSWRALENVSVCDKK